MAAVTFFFQGKDNTTKVFKSVNKSFKDLNKQIKTVTKTLKTLQSAFSGALGVITGVLKSALSLAVNLVKKAVSAIKSLVSGVLSFVKSALSTLLSWMKSALGKIFDWISVSFKKVATTTINAAKKAVKLIVSAVQAYADKEYNSIQLRLAFGSDFEMVEKEFKDLLKYTTSDKNDLWSIIATYAEMGKSARDALKYARATVYLSNATGKSLDSITRMLLMQEALSRDLDKTLAKVGVHISGAKADMTDIERIIAGMQEEMQALMSDSLNQKFANVKNAWITIKETIGSLMSGPVGRIAEKLATLLEKLNKRIGESGPAIEAFWKRIEPIIDKVFEFFEKFIQDPKGFFENLWKDIQQIFSNLAKNFGTYLLIIGNIIGKLIGKILDAMASIDWGHVTIAFDALASALNSFLLGFGHGLGIFSDEDVANAEGKLYKALMSAWNRAHEDWQLSEDDKWYKTLWKIINGILEDVDALFVDWWNGLDWDIASKIELSKEDRWYKNLWALLTGLWKDVIKPKVIDPLIETLKTAFMYLGEVLGVAINNAIASSETIRKVLNIIPGVNFGSQAELEEKQNSLYEKTKNYLPAGWTAKDLTYENLMSQYSKNQTWLYHLLSKVEDAREELTWIRKTDVLASKEYPSFNEFLANVDKIWNPVEESAEDINGRIVDASKSFREIDASVGNIEQIISKGGSGFVLSGPGSGAGGGGGIQDYYGDNEFRIKPYAKGGMVTKPTLALIGEAGPEMVIPLKNLTKMADADPGKNGFTFDIKKEWENSKIELGILDDLFLITKDTSFLVNWFRTTPLIDDVEDIKDETEEKTPWYKTLWNGIKKIGAGIASVWKTSGIGETFRDTAFGSHIGNIWSGIQTQAENKTLTIWTAIGEVLKEFLPYLQKGLEVVGSLFDDAFEILGNAVSILGERIGTMLLPILEAFVPLMKEIADILIALSPVIEAVLQPAIIVIAAILRALVPILDLLMPAFAGIGAVIQWVSDAISWAIGSFLNWLGDIHIGDWYPFAGVGGNSVKKPTSIKENYNSIMGAYNEARANVATGVSTSVSASGQTASYSGASHVYITNDFSGAYVVGSDGFRELAKIIKNEFEDAGYSRQNL